MADLKLYVQKIPQIEGTKYEWDTDRYRKFGIGTDDIERATGQKITESDMKNMEWGNPLIEKALGWYWHGVMANYYPQSIAETITDQVFNKGMGSVCGIQNMLITRYKARISADGKFGAETCGAILAAVKKYGEKHVYNSLYAYRYAYYTGQTLPQNGTCKNNSCSRPICKTLLNTRLNRYYPQHGIESVENLLLPVNDDGISRMDVLAYRATSTLQEATNTDSNHQKKYLVVAVGILSIVAGSLYLAIKMIWK
jgi:hypothetical protein